MNVMNLLLNYVANLTQMEASEFNAIKVLER